MKTKALKRRTPVAKRPARRAGSSNGSAKAGARGTKSSSKARTSAASKVAADLPIIYVNGQMLPKSKAMVSVYDHGLLYGDGVFEGIRVYQGKIFKCKQHMDRLYRCAESIHLKIPITPDEMVTVQRQCIEANN